MRLSVIGTGYVGLVTGACLADVGNDVLCVDIDAAKVERLKRGAIPMHEPGLEQVVARNAAAGRLRFSTAYDDAVAHADVVFIAVGTPPACRAQCAAPAHAHNRARATGRPSHPRRTACPRR